LAVACNHLNAEKTAKFWSLHSLSLRLSTMNLSQQPAMDSSNRVYWGVLTVNRRMYALGLVVGAGRQSPLGAERQILQRQFGTPLTSPCPSKPFRAISTVLYRTNMDSFGQGGSLKLRTRALCIAISPLQQHGLLQVIFLRPRRRFRQANSSGRPQ